MSPPLVKGVGFSLFSESKRSVYQGIRFQCQALMVTPHAGGAFFYVCVCVGVRCSETIICNTTPGPGGLRNSSCLPYASYAPSALSTLAAAASDQVYQRRRQLSAI